MTITLKERECYFRDAMNYIVRYTGDGQPDADKLRKVLADHQIDIIDGSSLPKMALVDRMNDSFISQMNQLQPGWKAFPQENSFSVPDTRRKTR